MPKSWKVSLSHCTDLVSQLLHNRGIKTKKDRESFLNPRLSDYEDLFNIPEIGKASDRILKAVRTGELIIVYGDYDVDGICATAILYHGLASIGATVLPYIPHREKEGYGLSEEGLRKVKEKGAKLVITVDNGIVALKQAQIAAKLGLDLIITDHHIAAKERPKCVALAHSTNMCGAAVGWCLTKSFVTKDLADELLDFVAIATICDLIPLVGVNRALVKAGLGWLNQTKRVGLLALFAKSGINRGEITSYEVSHILGPRLNAIGRLEHSIDALRLLCTKDADKASRLADLLCATNDQKKQLTANAIIEAKMMVESQKETLKEREKILILHSKDWIPGIIGLVAGRIRDEYKMSTVVISVGEKYSKGSVRSANGLDAVETIRKCTDILVDVGGHPKAAGFTIETAKIEDFKRRLKEVVEPVVGQDDDELEIEAVLDVNQISKKMLQEIALFEPFGVGNPRPVLASKNVKISNLKTVGMGQHLKFLAEKIGAIAFSFGAMINLLKEGQFVNLAYYLELDRYNGDEKIQLKILDIQPH